jgi:hypothetical protein
MGEQSYYAVLTGQDHAGAAAVAVTAAEDAAVTA